MVLEFAPATSANVYVTSGNEGKLKNARGSGTASSVKDREWGWDNKLLGMLATDKKLLMRSSKVQDPILLRELLDF